MSNQEQNNTEREQIEKGKEKNLGNYICEFLGREGEIKYNII